MKEILDNINTNIAELEQTQKDKSMVQIAIYQKSIEKIKKQKIQSLEKYLFDQIQYYNQSKANYEDKIKNIVDIYEKQIERLIAIYDYTYLTAFRLISNARNNQVIAIANIITSKKENNEKYMIACSQKKLNYSVIIEECDARIEWITKNIKKDIDEIFQTQNLALEVYKDNIFSKIRNKIFNKLFGKNKLNDLFLEYENNLLKRINNKNQEKIMEIAAIANGIVKQIDLVKKQIDEKYSQMIMD